MENNINGNAVVQQQQEKDKIKPFAVRFELDPVITTTPDGGREVTFPFPPELNSEQFRQAGFHVRQVAQNPLTDSEGYIGSDVILQIFCTKTFIDSLLYRHSDDMTVYTPEDNAKVNALIREWAEYTKNKRTTEKAANRAAKAARKEEVKQMRKESEPARKAAKKALEDRRKAEHEKGKANRKKYAEAQGFEFDEAKGEIVRGPDGKLKKKEKPASPGNAGGGI